jgi:hypothetical protein
MFALPHILPLLNFETIRCELKHCCRESEDLLVASAGPLLERLSDPEGQRFQNAIHKVRVSLQWLRQRIHTFDTPQHTASRADWNKLVSQVTQELQLLQRRTDCIHARIFEVDVGHRETQSENSQKKLGVCDQDQS